MNRWRKLNPLFPLFVLLPLLGWSASFEAMVLRRRADLASARDAYTMALALSRSQLAGALGKVTADGALAQNLSWKLNHSVAGTLQGKLQKGTLDQVTLFDHGCTELGRASLDRYESVACPKTGGAVPESTYWVESGGGRPALALTRPLNAGGSEAYAVGVVQLDDSWLALHPELQNRMAALGLKLGGAGVELIRDGNGAALTSSQILDRVLQTRAGLELASGNPLLIPCLCGTLLCAALALLRERQRRQKARDAIAAFTDWCRTLTPGGEVKLPGRTASVPAATLGEDVAADLTATKSLITHALELKIDDLRAATAERQTLAEQLAAMGDEIVKYRQRLAELAELDSLAVQLSRTSSSFLERIDAFREETADLAGVVDGSINASGREMFRLLEGWQRGVAERGSRKFIRGLSETPTGHGDESELDRQVAHLASLAATVADSSLHATTAAGRLVDTASFAARIASLWRALALKSQDDSTSPSLRPPAEEAQGLVLLTIGPGGDGALSFSNGLDPEGTTRLPELPPKVWISSLYHAYLSLAELAAGFKATIASRLRVDGDKAMLVLQMAADGDGPLPRRGNSQAYHLEIARSMLAPYGISVTALPALDGPFPIAISWSATDAYKRRGAGKAARSATHNVPGVV